MKNTGFTLIELMIVVAIIAILASIGYPSYVHHLEKSRRSDAMTALTQIKLQQNQLRANCRFYGLRDDSTTACGNTAGTTTFTYPSTSPEGYYTLDVSANTTQGYIATATADPAGAQAGDTDCSPMTLEVKPGDTEGEKLPNGCW